MAKSVPRTAVALHKIRFFLIFVAGSLLCPLFSTASRDTTKFGEQAPHLVDSVGYRLFVAPGLQRE